MIMKKKGRTLCTTLVVLLLIVCYLGTASATLTAFLAFPEGSGTQTVVPTGDCSTPTLYINVPSNQWRTTVVNGHSGINITQSTFPELSAPLVLQGTTGLTFGAWYYSASATTFPNQYYSNRADTNAPPTMPLLKKVAITVKKDTLFSLQVRKQTAICKILLANQLVTVYNSGLNTSAEWVYLACTWGRGQVCAWVNSSKVCLNVSGSIPVDSIFSYGPLIIGGASIPYDSRSYTQPVNAIDDITIWSDSISAIPQLSRTTQFAAPTTDYSVVNSATNQLYNKSNIVIDYYDKAVLSITSGTDGAKTRIVQTGNCGVIDSLPVLVSIPFKANLSANDLGSTSFSLCTQIDPSSSSYLNYPLPYILPVALTIAPSAPRLISIPSTNLTVAVGQNVFLQVTVEAYPPPRYQWYRQAFKPVEDNDTSSEDSTGIAKRDFERREFTHDESYVYEFVYTTDGCLEKRYPRSYEGVPQTQSEFLSNHFEKRASPSSLSLSNSASSTLSRSNSPSPTIAANPSSSPLINNTAGTNDTELVAYWEPIPNANSATLSLSNVDSTYDGAAFYVNVDNGVNITSPPIFLYVSKVLTPPGGDGDGTTSQTSTQGSSGGLNRNALIGIIVGSVAGCCCLFLMLCMLFIIIIIVVRKRTRDQYRAVLAPKLIKPDFGEYIYKGSNNDAALVKAKNNSAYNALERLLCGEEGNNSSMNPRSQLELATAIMDRTKVEDIADSCKRILFILESKKRSLGETLIIGLLEAELKESNLTDGTLFRTNSAPQRLFSFWAKMIGLNYLWDTLAAPINELDWRARQKAGEEDGGEGGSDGTKMRTISASESLYDISMEIDPSKESDAGAVEVNTLELWLTAQKILRGITKKENKVPKGVINIITYLAGELASVNDEQVRYIAYGNFFWLRFICPLLIVPQQAGLLREPAHPLAQRQLILLSKVLQNLANDTLPGNKEAYMAKLNEFISTNREPLRKFYGNLVSKGQHGGGATEDVDVPEDVLKSSLVYFHQWLYSRQTEIEGDLSDEMKERFRAVMADLGKPPSTK